MSGLVNKKVQVVLGSTLVAVCNAMSALIKDGPVQWCFSSAFRPPAGSYAFSTGVSSALLSDFVVRYTRQRGWSKTALLTSTDATGQDGDRTFDTTLALPENLRVVMVAHEHFNIGDLSVAAQIARIKTSGAQVLFAWTTGTQLATILHAASDAGLAIPIVTTSGNSTYPQMKAYASFLPKEFYFTGVLSLAPNELPNSPVKSTILSYLSAFRSTGIRPDIGSNQAWDGAQILIEALKKLGLNATPSQIRDYVVNLRGWSGINGQYDFQRYPQRGVGLEWLTMQRWDTAKDSWVGVSKLGGAPF